MLWPEAESMLMGKQHHCNTWSACDGMPMQMPAVTFLAGRSLGSALP